MIYLVVAAASFASFAIGVGLTTYYFLWLDRQSGLPGGGARPNRFVGMPNVQSYGKRK